MSIHRSVRADVEIKANSYCPICRGVTLCEHHHGAEEFNVPKPYSLTAKEKAAAELYEVLKSLMGGDEKLQVGIGGNPKYVDDFIRKTEAILAKAEGRPLEAAE